MAPKALQPVDKIVGPGNAYVAAAKREVFGQVGIDSIAGPSEILVIADGGNDPDWIAADLLSQAEHDASSQSILITDDADFADQVADAAERALAILPRKEIAVQKLERLWRASLWCRSWTRRAPLADRFAPEHLEIATADPEALLAQGAPCRRDLPGTAHARSDGRLHRRPQPCAADIPHGAFLLGPSVLDFMKRTTILGWMPASIAALGPEAIALAEAEGLDAHARSIAARLNRRD